jgi:hypothetical protein
LCVLGSLARDELDAVDDLFGGVVEVVDDDHFVVGLEQGQGCEGADVARAASDEDGADDHDEIGLAAAAEKKVSVEESTKIKSAESLSVKK